LGDDGCSDVCPVECNQPGTDAKWPTYYIDPSIVLTAEACMPQCPFHAIFPSDELPAVFKAKDGEYFNEAGLTGHYETTNHCKQKIVLETTRVLATGEILDLRESIKTND
jgi:ferredoxin